MDILLITHENKSHCIYMKDFNRFMCNKKKKKKNKKHFCSYFVQFFSSEKVLEGHKRFGFKINGN